MVAPVEAARRDRVIEPKPGRVPDRKEEIRFDRPSAVNSRFGLKGMSQGVSGSKTGEVKGRERENLRDGIIEFRSLIFRRNDRILQIEASINTSRSSKPSKENCDSRGIQEWR